MSNKTIKCASGCNRMFATPEAMAQHCKDAHTKKRRNRKRAEKKLAQMEDVGKAGAMAVLDGITTDDTSDEMFWALAADLGLEVNDFIEK